MYRSFASATASASPSPFVDVDSTIRGLTQDLCTAFNTGNYDQWAALFASDAQLMPPNHEPVQGLKAIERVMRELGEAGHHDLRFETAQIILTGDVAVEIGRYTAAISQGNGTTVAQRGKYLRAWRRLGAWLIVADCWNSNLPLGKGQ
jgi:uncharacterized protein (TIGR02246 family)